MDNKDKALTHPVTECPNELSKNIDVSSPFEIASILHKCDKQIFEGWLDPCTLTSAEMVGKISTVASHIEAVLKDPSSGTVVVSGCGTSGRLAYLVVRMCNQYLKSQGKAECFQYIIAGNDRALFSSLEMAEDDPHAGAKCLEQAVKGKSRVVYIGVSCGLSAVFVAGQLDLCLSDLSRFMPVVIGFNPVHLARKLPVQNWDKTFSSVLLELQKAERSNQACIINPIIGPEPITGSTRMKSGSATRIILECLSLTALHGFTHSRISQLLQCYRETCDSVYKNKEVLGKVIHMAGESLSRNGHIYYLGGDGFGLMAMIDASECHPTYSAALDDVRGFVSGGYETLASAEGDLSHLGPHYKISLKDFEDCVQPGLEDKDLLVVIGKDVFQEVQSLLGSSKCKKIFIGFDLPNVPTEINEQVHLSLNVHLQVPSLAALSPSHVQDSVKRLLQEIALKWVVNNLSTGAHVLKGKVCENRMIDLKVSNSKLYYRGIGIIQNFAKCSETKAEESLLKSLYNQDEISSEVRSKTVADHIYAGAEQDQVVPTAILLASLSCTVNEAREMIRGEPVIRRLLATPPSS